MDLIMLVLGLALIGVIVWAITTYIPMPPTFKFAIYVVSAIFMILWLVNQLGGRIPNVIR